MTNMLMSSPKPTSCHFQRAPVFLPWAEHFRLNHGEPVLAPIKAIEGFVSDFSVSKLSQAVMGAGPQAYFALHLQPEEKKETTHQTNNRQGLPYNFAGFWVESGAQSNMRIVKPSSLMGCKVCVGLQGPKKLLILPLIWFWEWVLCLWVYFQQYYLLTWFSFKYLSAKDKILPRV